MSVVSAHVSVCPNHQNLWSTPLETRFPIAAFGVCGYEYNLCETSEEEFAAVFHGKNRDRRGLRLVPLCSAHASCHMRNGVCGYEYNLCETSEEEFAAVFHGKNRDRRGLRLVPLCSAHASCHMRNLPAVGGLLDKAGAFDGILPIAAADLIDGRI